MTDLPVFCPNINALREIQRGLQNRTAQQAIAELVKSVADEFEEWHKDHRRLRDECTTVEGLYSSRITQIAERVSKIEALDPVADKDLVSELASIANTEAQLTQRIEQLEYGQTVAAKRLTALERWSREQIKEKHGLSPGPLPAITDPEQFIRELYQKVSDMDGSQEIGEYPRHVQRDRVLGLIRDLIENRGIDPRLILEPPAGSRLRQCRGVIEGLGYGDVRCELVEGHLGRHGFAT